MNIISIDRLSKDALLAEQRGNVDTNFETIYDGGSDMDRTVTCTNNAIRHAIGFRQKITRL